MDYDKRAGLSVAQPLLKFIEQEALPGTGIDSSAVLNGFAALIRQMAPRNAHLLEKRDALQAKIDDAYTGRDGEPLDSKAQLKLLREIGYLVPEPAPFSIETGNVDVELSDIAGPQLVVPVTNPRYVLNAANARWGSVYDALYGTDAIPEEDGATRSGPYNPARGTKIIARGKLILDRVAALTRGRHDQDIRY